MPLNLQNFVSDVSSRIGGFIPNEEEIKRKTEQAKIALSDFVKKQFTPKQPISPVSGEETQKVRLEQAVERGLKTPISPTFASPEPTRRALPSPTPIVVVKPSPAPVLGVKSENKPFYKEIKEAFGNLTGDAYRVLSGENARFQTGKEADAVNRIDPATGKWRADVPPKKEYNPFTNQDEDSVDRGLFRVNNGTFYLLLNSKKYRPMMKKAGIIATDDVKKIYDSGEWRQAWDQMLNPKLNAQMGRIIYQFHKDIGGTGWDGWVAAPEDMK